jgi:cytochrome c biogenesis protein CcdA
MDLTPIAYAYGAGMLAAFNPCGFVLLPTYIAAFLADGTHGGAQSAVGTSGRITAGFLVVFALLGGLVGGLGASVATVGSLASWLGVVTGVLLVVAGLVMLAGRKLPGIQIRVGSSRGAFSYGFGYAAASLACALPVFLSAVVYVFDRGGIVAGLFSGVAYAAGMGSVVSLVVVLTSTARQGAVHRLRSVMRYFTPVAGVLLVVSGVLLALRRWVQFPILEHLSGVVVDAADSAVWLPAGVLAVVVAVLIVRQLVRRRSERIPPSSSQTERGAVDTTSDPVRSLS